MEGFMTTKRVPIVRSTPQRVTPRAIDLFRYALKLEDDGSSGTVGYNRIAVELHRELHRAVWDWNLLDVDVDDDPPDEPVPMKLASWHAAIALRAALEQAVAEHERPDAETVTLASPQ
jgi:hypothetical protein